MSEFFGQIGFFQLLNLVKNRVPFLLATVGISDVISSSKQLKQILEKGQAFELSSAAQEIAKLQPDKSSPIVLLCDKGEQSALLAKQLAGLGYINIFVVKNGVEGLLVELTEGF